MLVGCSYAAGVPAGPPVAMPDASQVVPADVATGPDAPWTWSVIETMTIDSTSTTPQLSQMTLAAGVEYRLSVSGTFTCTYGGALGDAEYWWDATNQDWADTSGSVDFGLALDDAAPSNAKTPHWGPLVTAHAYEITYVGKGTPLQALINDIQYDNNSGSLQLQILAHD